MEIFGREPTTLDELAQCVIAVINEYQYITEVKGKLVKTKKPRVVGFAWDIRHSDEVSNTHSSPLNGVMNFRREENSPTGYPGWIGRVWIRYSNDERYSFDSDPFGRTATYTGTGGYGGYRGPWEMLMASRYNRYGHDRSKEAYPEIAAYSWDYRFYDADWPLIAEFFEKQRMWAVLNNQNMATPQHRFSWEDPETKLADDEFMKNFAAWKAKKIKKEFA